MTDDVPPMSPRMARFMARSHRRLDPATIAKRRNNNIRRSTPPHWLAELCELQQWRCHYCGHSMRKRPSPKHPGKEATLEHLYPISRGGRNQRANVVAACQACNCAKGSMTVAEFEASKAPDAS